MNPQILKLIGAFAGGLAVGGALGYFITEKKLRNNFNEVLDEEVEKVEEQYKLLRKENITIDDVSPHLAAQVHQQLSKDPEYAEALVREFGTRDEHEEQVLKDLGYSENPEPGESHNVFEAVVPEEDVDPRKTELDILKENRTYDTPYIIAFDEFNEIPQYDSVVLHYYAGDDILTDDKKTPIPKPELVLGPDALSSFGKFSGDMEIVYVRDEKLETDIEVIRDERSYAEMVMGIKPDKSSFRMREDD